MQGWLYKKRPDGTAAISTWKHRWCVLRPGEEEIDYYKKETDKKRKGIVDIRGLQRIVPISSADLGSGRIATRFGTNGLTLICLDRSVHLIPETPQERVGWLQALSKAIPTAKLHYQLQLALGTAQSASTGALSSPSAAAASLLGLSPASSSLSASPILKSGPLAAATATASPAPAGSPGNPFGAGTPVPPRTVSASSPGNPFASPIAVPVRSPSGEAWPSAEDAAAVAASSPGESPSSSVKKKGLFGRILGGKKDRGSKDLTPAAAAAVVAVVASPAQPSPSSSAAPLPSSGLASPVAIVSTAPPRASMAPGAALATSPGNPFGPGPTASGSGSSSSSNVGLSLPSVSTNPFANFAATTGASGERSSSSSSSDARMAAVRGALVPSSSPFPSLNGKGSIQNSSAYDASAVSVEARVEGDDSDADNNDHSGHSGAPRSLRKSAVSRKSVVGAGGLRRPSNRYKAGDGAAVPLIAEDDLSGEGAGSGDAEAVRVRVDGEENGDDEDENEDDDDDDEDDDAPKKGCCARCIVQ